MTGILKRMSPTAYFLLVVLIIMVVLLIASLGYTEMKTKLMPVLVSGFTIGVTLVALFVDLRTGSNASRPTDEDGDVIEDEKIVGTPLSAYFKAFFWFAGLIAMVFGVGFIVAMPIWMFLYLWKNGYLWWKGILHGLILTVIIYIVFTVFLQVELYRGVVGEWLYNLVGL